MAVEAELKLALPAAQREHATRVLEAIAGGAGRPIRLSNVYYDTPTLDLKRARSALRVRLAGDRWLQTFKSGGGAQGGLHRRHEWEMPVAGDGLERDALIAAVERDLAAAHASSSAAHDAEHASLSAALQTLRDAFATLGPLFRTDFTRTLWNVTEGDAQIEIGFDDGEVIAGDALHRRTLPILEIELELKRGDESALERLAARLRERIPGLAADDVSKAERGYRLIDATPR
ncbi:CYTH domain-containing protein [Pararobbsia silviterrae]|uniref:CYTH domain-containing protein n=1 Tax=Pararobbsia silviterrae TaxID=1792498 RepID=A0A494X506_9BURK|nr:CYTH domain-containing protein [Pararobbsia silviterrae]RKP45778.1 CYTH domain-containing protein [Pararobbsia silviterrae]